MDATTCRSCGGALALEQTAAPHHHAQPQAAYPGAPAIAFEAGPGNNPIVQDQGSFGSATKACPTCKSMVPINQRFCGSCGQTLVDNQAKQTASKGASRPGEGVKKTMFFGAMQAARAKLVVIRGDGMDGVSYTLAGDDHQAGRDLVPLQFADDPYMSPVHANFFYQSGQLVVRDETSVNGVFIRIRRTVPIEFGDRFLVGEQVMEVQPTLPESYDNSQAIADGTFFYSSPHPALPFRLIQLLRGGDTGLAFHGFADVISLGREGNDINFPDDPFISGHHAQVTRANGAITLTDLGSKNGTFVRVQKETPLQHGDYVFLGQQLLRVEIV